MQKKQKKCVSDPTPQYKKELPQARSPRRRETCEDSHVTAVARTSKDSFEAASTGQKTQYYVGVVKDKRTGKNGLEFLIVWREYPTLT
jgi:hypothetical protein